MSTNASRLIRPANGPWALKSGIEADFDDGVYEPILALIRRQGRFDAIGYDLVLSRFDNSQPDFNIDASERREAMANVYAERYRRKRGIPEKKRRREPPVVHKFRVMLDTSPIIHKPRVMIDRSRVLIDLRDRYEGK